MRWTPGDTSEDIEDRRNEGGGWGGLAGGSRGVQLGIGGTIVLLVLSVIFKQDFFSLLSGAPSPSGTYVAPARAPNPAQDAREERLVKFVSFVLDDVQRTWGKVLHEGGVPYRHAKLVLFRDVTQSACGSAQAATGPFYCPGDEKVYIDLGFYDELKQRFGAPGEFAQAYVLAHEVGHHVQKVLGIEPQVRQAQARNPRIANQLSVRLELQADCFAGIWGRSTAQRNILEQGDAESGLNAAAAVGDDRLQRMGTGRVRSESFTHGSSAQRVEWFRRGMSTGDVKACNTFASRAPARGSPRQD
jgi:hypothetical protein